MFYNIFIVIVELVSLQDPQHALSQLMRIAILSELTLMLAWNVEEAASILETYKLFENKPPDLIMERSGGEAVFYAEAIMPHPQTPRQQNTQQKWATNKYLHPAHASAKDLTRLLETPLVILD